MYGTDRPLFQTSSVSSDSCVAYSTSTRALNLQDEWQHQQVGLLVQALSEATSQAAEQLDAQAVSMVLWSIASLTRLRPPPASCPSRAPLVAAGEGGVAPGGGAAADLEPAVNEGVMGRKGMVSTGNGEQEEQARQDSGGLSTTSSPNLVASSIRHKAASARLVHRLLHRLQWCSGKLSGQDIATCYYALASLGVQPGAAGAALAAAVKQQVGEMNGQDVSSIMWAQAILNHDPLLDQPAARAHHACSDGCGSKSKDATQQGARGGGGGAAGGGAARGGGGGGGAGHSTVTIDGGRLNPRLGGSHEWRREEGGTRVEERLSWCLMQRASQLAHTLEARHVCNIFWAAASLGLLSLLSPNSVGVWYKGRRWQTSLGGRWQTSLGGRWQTSLDPQATPPHAPELCTLLGSLSQQLLRVLRDAGEAGLEAPHLCQLHQFFLSCELLPGARAGVGGGGGAGAPLLTGPSRRLYSLLRKDARTAFETLTAASRVSALQRDVAHALAAINLPTATEVIEERSGYSIDMVLLLEQAPGGSALAAAVDLPGSPVQAEGGWGCEGSAVGGAPAGWLVEVDGPSHFLEHPSNRPRGSTLLKRRHLQALGSCLSLSLFPALRLGCQRDTGTWGFCTWVCS